MIENQPPQSEEAEQSVLGAMLIEPRCIDDVADILLDGDFYRKEHREIYKTIIDLSAEGSAVDVVTVSDVVGDLAYLSSLAKNTPSTHNAKSYARIVRKNAKLRSIIEICGDAIGEAFGDNSPDYVANNLGNKLDAIESVNDNTAQGMKEIARLAVNELEHRHQAKTDLIGFSTGLADVDRATGGLTGGSLVVIGGRPAMGKTCFALNIVDRKLADGGIGIMFSMEMGKTEVFNRQWAAKSGISLKKIRQPKTLADDEWHRLTPASSILADYKLLIDDQSGLHLNQIRSRARAYKRKQGFLDFIIVDYLTLMNLGEGDNRVNQIGEVTKGLKNLARDLDITVILLSQLNRSLESRPNKRPVMSDLRDSGAIEQDADVIAFLYRDEEYKPDTEQKGIAEVNFAKQRNEATAVVRLVFKGELQRFSDMAYPQLNGGQ